jgi:heat shock protein HslJ
VLALSGCGSAQGAAIGDGVGTGSSSGSSGSSGSPGSPGSPGSASSASSPGSSNSSSRPDARTALVGRHFTGTTAIGRQLAPGSTVRLGFTTTTLSLDAGCNQLSGNYSFDGRTLRVKRVALTAMACPPGLGAQDSWLTALLSGAPAAALDGSTLTIGSPTKRLTLHEQGGQELLGTTWAIQGTSVGTVTSPLPKGTGASVTFDGGGEHGIVRTGCNSGGLAVSSLTGQGQRRGTIALRPAVMTRIACRAELMFLDHTVIAVLSGSVHYAIDGEALTIVNDAPGKHGLTLKAQRPGAGGAGPTPPPGEGPGPVPAS